MYVPVNLNLNNDEISRLITGGSMKVNKTHLKGGRALNTNATQARRINNVNRGTQKQMTLKMTPSQVKNNVKSDSIWRQIWNSVKSKAGPALAKGAEILTQQAINAVAHNYGQSNPSYNLNEGISHLKKGKGRPSLNNAVYNTGANRAFDNTNFNNEAFNNMASRRRAKPTGRFNNEVYNTATDRVDHALLGMGFKKKHVTYMRGSGVFGSLWRGTKRATKFVAPLIATHLTQLMLKRMFGGNNKSVIKFTLPQRREIYGNSIFSDVINKIKDMVKKPAEKKSSLVDEIKTEFVNVKPIRHQPNGRPFRRASGIFPLGKRA